VYLIVVELFIEKIHKRKGTIYLPLPGYDYDSLLVVVYHCDECKMVLFGFIKREQTKLCILGGMGWKFWVGLVMRSEN